MKYKSANTNTDTTTTTAVAVMPSQQHLVFSEFEIIVVTSVRKAVMSQEK